MNYTNKSVKELKEWLRNNLTDEKYIHSLGTMNCAGELARKFNMDVEKAVVAGLLHDCAKNYTKKEMLKYVSEYDVNVTPKEMANPKTLHAPLGAFIAAHEFGVHDCDILNAIRYHTVGCKEMTDFEKIIFIADKIEENTRGPKLRKKVLEILSTPNGLNKAMAYLLYRTIKRLEEKGKAVDEQTLSLYRYFKK